MRAALLAALTAGLAASGCLTFGDAGFPKSYLLEEDEIPSGLKLRALDEGGEEAPVATNPGEVFPEFVGDEFGGDIPEGLWGEFFLPVRGDAYDEVGIYAARWDAAADADAAARIAKEEACPDDDFGLLRDGNVLVFVWGDSDGVAYVDRLASALKAKTGSLSILC
ncbi:MAG: hypothetical protein HYT80_07700 [Euryarchaeota archaeon]|nr:hypothetical protein [Euryarchaeota archaeon]